MACDTDYRSHSNSIGGVIGARYGKRLIPDCLFFNNVGDWD
jgi:hypothetical protein